MTSPLIKTPLEGLFISFLENLNKTRHIYIKTSTFVAMAILTEWLI